MTLAANRRVGEPVECVILDLFGVVIAFDDSLVYDRLAARCADRATAYEAMRDLVSNPDLIRGRLSLEDVRSRLVSDLGLDMSIQEFQQAWATPYSEPLPGMREAIRSLSRSCRLVLLSNVDKYYWSTVATTIPELALFDAHVLSWEVGTAKPDPVAFGLALRAAGVPPARCYFFDDKAENVEAAAAIGIRGEVFRSCHAMRLVLRSCGLAV